MEMKFNIKNFKTLSDITIEPGAVNVFIGANGTGKSALLEALGVLSSAVSEKVDDAALNQKGVRLGTPSLYKSAFKNAPRTPLTIEFNVEWKLQNENWNYKVHLNNPIDNPKPAWEYYSELLMRNEKKIFGRSRASRSQLENFPEITLDTYKGLLSFLQGIGSVNSSGYAQDFYQLLKDYAIYTPNTTTLRGIQTDPFQRDPLGLLGGRLPEVIDDLLDLENENFGNMDLDDLLELLGWTQSILVGKAPKDTVSPNIPIASKTIRFTDRFMKEGRNELTPYDASEGSVYVLFMLTLALHHKTPRMFAVDNFDQALNPRLARALTRIFCDQVIKNDKMCFITTHNPLVLDGLNLNDERIRLFTVDRDSHGHTRIERIVVDQKLLDMNQSLSKLWTTGLLGGVPNL